MPQSSCPVNCTCHQGPHYPCSEAGGCGSAGCGRETTNDPRGDCAVCHRRDPEHGLVCEPCRTWLPTAIRSIPRMAAQLAAEVAPEPEPDQERTRSDDAGREHPHRDPIATTLTASVAPSVPTDKLITTGGTGEAPTPLNLHTADLLGPVVRDGGRPIDATGDNWLPVIVDSKPRKVWTDNGWRHVGRREYRPAGDQIGVIPVAVALDQEMRAMADAGAPGALFRPKPTIGNLCDWIVKRLDWACDHYPGVGALAEQVRYVRGQLMAALGEFEVEEELCVGVECNRCTLRMLYRRSDGSGDVECHNPACRKIFTKDEYLTWSTHLGAYEKSLREPAEVTELLKRRYPPGVSS